MYIHTHKNMVHNILAQISKPPPRVCGSFSAILKGTFMKFCITNNESMSYIYTSVKLSFFKHKDFIKILQNRAAEIHFHKSATTFQYKVLLVGVPIFGLALKNLLLIDIAYCLGYLSLISAIISVGLHMSNIALWSASTIYLVSDMLIEDYALANQGL